MRWFCDLTNTHLIRCFAIVNLFEAEHTDLSTYYRIYFTPHMLKKVPWDSLGHHTKIFLGNSRFEFKPYRDLFSCVGRLSSFKI